MVCTFSSSIALSDKHTHVRNFWMKSNCGGGGGNTNAGKKILDCPKTEPTSITNTKTIAVTITPTKVSDPISNRHNGSVEFILHELNHVSVSRKSGSFLFGEIFKFLAPKKNELNSAWCLPCHSIFWSHSNRPQISFHSIHRLSLFFYSFFHHKKWGRWFSSICFFFKFYWHMSNCFQSKTRESLQKWNVMERYYLIFVLTKFVVTLSRSCRLALYAFMQIFNNTLVLCSALFLHSLSLSLSRFL